MAVINVREFPPNSGFAATGGLDEKTRPEESVVIIRCYSIFLSAITGEGSIAIYESGDLKKHRKLLRHFLRQDVQLQIQAIHALQICVQSSQLLPSVLQVDDFCTCIVYLNQTRYSK